MKYNIIAITDYVNYVEPEDSDSIYGLISLGIVSNDDEMRKLVEKDTERVIQNELDNYEDDEDLRETVRDNFSVSEISSLGGMKTLREIILEDDESRLTIKYISVPCEK